MEAGNTANTAPAEAEGLCDVAKSLATGPVELGTIEAQQTVLGKPFPLVLSPAAGVHVNFIRLQEYMTVHHEAILEAASRYGAVMFSGFDVVSGEEWASVLAKTGMREMEYAGGAAVRRLIVGCEERMNMPQVLTTNESPPSEPIPMHHEMAQTPNPPTHICFFCKENAAQGGSTPLIRSDLVYNFLNDNYPDFIHQAEELGAKYARTVPEVDDPASAQGRSWKAMFSSNTREEAEAAMTEKGFTWEWHDNGNCTVTSAKLDAVRVCSNGSKAFFNQIVAAYTGWVDSRNEYGKSVVFGDGTPLPQDAVEHLAKFMEENKCAYRWAPGQFCIVDNTVAYHAREPFTGRRQILAAVGGGQKPVTADDQKTTHLVLSRGDKMPQVGYGCWKLPKDSTQQHVYQAIKEGGYRLIDEASGYGNETECGLGIKQAIDEGVVTREQMWVTSKLWNTYHRPERVREACLKSLQDLGLEYLDLYLMHYPLAMKFVPFEEKYPAGFPLVDGVIQMDEGVSMAETWAAMEGLVAEGLVRNIGISNINIQLLRDVCSYAKVKPAVVQNEIHPYNSCQVFLRFCRQKGIAVTAYSSLGGSSYTGMGWAQESESCLNDPVMAEIGEAHGKTAAQVALRWGVQRGTAILPKTTSVARMHENIGLFDFALTDEEMAKIDAQNRNRRFCDPGDNIESRFGVLVPVWD